MNLLGRRGDLVHLQKSLALRRFNLQVDALDFQRIEARAQNRRERRSTPEDACSGTLKSPA
jgi:hypothetical protein